jgi:hypothetical protein
VHTRPILGRWLASASPVPLHRIAAYVDEPAPGWFAWTLAEAAEDMSNWTQIEHADE